MREGLVVACFKARRDLQLLVLPRDEGDGYF